MKRVEKGFLFGWGLACVSAVAGCGGGTTQNSTIPSSAGLTILSFGSNVKTITAGQSVLYVAVVTDTAGLDKLAGGQLTDPTSQIFYGAFDAQQGGYALNVSWDQLNQAMPINFAMTDSRMVVAEFFDQYGNTASKSATIGLTCNGMGACNGRCVDLTTDPNNCGMCGQKVTATQTCVGGKPHNLFGTCFNPSLGTTCSSYCTARGQTCMDTCGPTSSSSSASFSFAGCIGNGTQTSGSCATALSTAMLYTCCCG